MHVWNFDASRPLHLETDASGVEPNDFRWSMAWLVGMKLCPIAFASKSLLSAEQCYSSIECKTLKILHGLGKFYHYCFALEVCLIIDCKPLVAILSKDLATLAQSLQCIMLRIHQCRVCIIYKPGPDLYMADRLSWNNHIENRYQEIASMNMNINTISTLVNMPVSTSIEEIQAETWDDIHLQKLKSHIIQGKHCETVCYMLGVPGNTTTGEDNPIWDIMPPWGWLLLMYFILRITCPCALYIITASFLS